MTFTMAKYEPVKKKKKALQVFISTDKKLCKVLGKQDNRLEEIEKQIIIKSTTVCAFL